MQRQIRPAVLPIAPRRAGLSLVALAISLAMTGCASHNSSNSGTNGTIGPNTLNVADAALAGGDPSMALNVSQSILANDPNNVDALIHEGDAYYALSRCPASEAAYRQALKYDPKSSDAQIGLGRCLLKVDPVQAEAAFLAATQVDPGNAAAFSNLGIARDLQGNFAGAADAYQQSLVLNAGSTATAVNLGLSLALSGHGQEALQYLGPIATGPDATPKIREDYAAALVAAGRNDQARQVLAIDMPSDKVNQTMAGFQSLIAANIANPSPPPPVAPTAAQVQTAPVVAMPMPQSNAAPMPLTPVASAVPVPAPAPLPVVAAAEQAPQAAVVAASAPKTAPAPHVAVAAPPPKPAAKPAPAPVAVAQAAPAKPAAQTSPAPKPAPVVAAVPAPQPVAAPAPAPAPKPAPAPAPVVAAAAAPAPVPKPAAPVPSPAQVAAITPAAAAPAVAPQLAPVPEVTPSSGSGAAVQIAALNTSAAAQAEWRKVSAKAPGLFAGKSPEISKVEVAGATYYRLRVGGFASHEDAAQFCSQLTAAGGPCMPANF